MVPKVAHGTERVKHNDKLSNWMTSCSQDIMSPCIYCFWPMLTELFMHLSEGGEGGTRHSMLAYVGRVGSKI